MPIRSFLSSCRRLIRLIGRPSFDELWSYIKIGLMGIGIIGVIGFIVKFIATMLQATPSG
ncbi:MAG: protein translocase SEC61 complex subunit gamma [Candidatus Bathyarchaeota archaeon]|nr:protein translocase SEC61 complex subunit gamma [Candidatus Bathyarchaeota archaeon]